jgi:hypothetical protein
MARRSEIGDLGLAESTPTNTEIAINQKTRPPLIAVYGVVVFLTMKN